MKLFDIVSNQVLITVVKLLIELITIGKILDIKMPLVPKRLRKKKLNFFRFFLFQKETKLK